MALRLITPPTQMPLSAAEMKEHLRVDSDDDNEYIDALIAAATDYVDGKYGTLQKALVEQQWEYSLDAFPCDGVGIALPLPPLISIDAIVYDDANGDEQVIAFDGSAPSVYVDDRSVPGRIIPIDGFAWPTTICAPNCIRILFTAGHVSVVSGGTDAPPAIVQAIKLIVADWYKNREDRALLQGPHVNIPTAAKALLDQHRIPAFA